MIKILGKKYRTFSDYANYLKKNFLEVKVISSTKRLCIIEGICHIKKDEIKIRVRFTPKRVINKTSVFFTKYPAEYLKTKAFIRLAVAHQMIPCGGLLLDTKEYYKVRKI